MKDNQQQLEAVRDKQQVHRISGTIRDSKKQWETVRDMQQLHGTGRDIKR